MLHNHWPGPAAQAAPALVLWTLPSRWGWSWTGQWSLWYVLGKFPPGTWEGRWELYLPGGTATDELERHQELPRKHTLIVASLPPSVLRYVMLKVTPMAPSLWIISADRKCLGHKPLSVVMMLYSDSAYALWAVNLVSLTRWMIQPLAS